MIVRYCALSDIEYQFDGQRLYIGNMNPFWVVTRYINNSITFKLSGTGNITRYQCQVLCIRYFFSFTERVKMSFRMR